MDVGYEKVKTEKQIPAMMTYLDRAAAGTYVPMYQPAFIPPHWHRSIEMSLVMEGNVELWINDERQTICEDEFIFVNSGSVHQLKEGGKDSTAVMVVIISYDFLKKTYPDIDQVHFELDPALKELDRIREIYRELKEFSQNPQPLDYIRVNGYLYEIVYFLLTKCAVRDKNTEQKMKKMNHTQKKILNYIDEHYREAISLKIMTEIFGVSEEHFSRRFHQFFGISFKNYIIKYRLYKAFEDVIQSDKSVQYIALECGFPNVKSFISHFKKEYKVTPYQYRKNYRQSRNDNL